MSTAMSFTTRHLAGRAAAALTVLVLSTACSAAATEARPAAAPEQSAATAGGAYDGWAVRLQWTATMPATCGWSPDQVERLLESEAPLPPCLSRLQRWFAKHYPAPR